MEKQIFSSATPQERAELLAGSSAKIEKGTYMQQLAPGERAELQEQLTKISIETASLKEEKRETVKEFNAALKDLQSQLEELIGNLKHNAREVEGKLYHIAYYEEKRMAIYNEHGELIQERQLYPNEMQSNIFTLKNAKNE